MNAEILAVGTELLMGQIANTNAQYISRRLSEAGVNVYYHSVVGDNPARLKECLNIALKRSDAVIMTGGLGPTQDDLTKETVAEVMGRKLVLHNEILEKIISFFNGINRPMSENNKRQAYFPENSIILENNKGTAPGCIIEAEGKTVVMLPGPPSEMKPMFDGSVMKYLNQKSNEKIVSVYIKIFGIGESVVEERIMDIVKNQSNPTIAPYAKEGEVTLRITAKCENKEDALKMINPVVQEIQKRLGIAVYSTEDKSMAEVVGELLIKSGMTIALAESCTGGLISAKLTDIPGISKVFNGGIVAYSNESKIRNLNVKTKTLERFGAVSLETAKEMAKGVREASGTDIGVAVTGIAGPDGGTEEKPVGLVYVALCDMQELYGSELRLWGDREKIRNITSLHVFDMIRQYIIGQIKM